MHSQKQKIINLDECVLNALSLFESTKLQDLDLGSFSRPLIIGSGNAAVVGKILFEEYDAVFATESDFLSKINLIKDIDGCYLISASGSKHAPEIAKTLFSKGLKVILLTNNKAAKASKYCIRTHIFPKNPEPYTYNVSTYLSMIFSKTKEDPSKIKKLLLELKFPKLKGYDSFFFILPEKFELVKDMFLTKFDELFGSKISARAYTFEQTKHAKTVIPSQKELFISFGYKNDIFGIKRWNIHIPEDISYGAMICLGYYIIGKIQSSNPPYFKRHIKTYLKFISKVFNEKFELIV